MDIYFVRQPFDIWFPADCTFCSKFEGFYLDSCLRKACIYSKKPAMPAFRIAPFRVSDSEEMAALVSQEGIHMRMPLRWVVQQRRYTVGSSNTIFSDLQGVLDLYRWAAKVKSAPADLDDFLAAGGQLAPKHLLSLAEWVRGRTFNRKGLEVVRSYGTIARRINSIAEFLGWAADIQGRGGETRIPAGELVLYRQRLAATFEGIKLASRGKRPDPLNGEQDQLLRQLLRPRSDLGGALAWPITFPGENPFSAKLQLRVWLCYLLMRDLGLRKGEVLKLTLQDVQGDVIKVRRRTTDPDPRNPVPKVKSRERPLPSNDAIKQALRAYISPSHPGRRRRGGYPYLITSNDGAPLSIASFDDMWDRISYAYGPLARLSPHVLRHTWAEAIAEDLLHRGHDEETAISLLRPLGGWSENSLMPQHYVQKALGKKAGEALKQYNDAMYKRSSLH